MIAVTISLDTLAEELEDPFGTEDNDLPLDAMCRTMERNALHLLGDTDISPPMQPVDSRLT